MPLKTSSGHLTQLKKESGRIKGRSKEITQTETQIEKGMKKKLKNRPSKSYRTV